MNDVDEIVQEFLVESHENLDQLDRDLVALEQEPDSRSLLGSIFRTIHTIKGTSGFLAFGQLEAVTHVGESLLSRLRDGHLQLTPEITSALLEMVDAVRGLLAEIEASGGEGNPDHTALIEKLGRLQNAEQAVAAAAAPAAAPEEAAGSAPEAAAAAEPAVEAAAEVKKPAAKRAARTRKPRASKPVVQEPPLLGEVLREQDAVSDVDVDLALIAQGEGDDRRIGDILVSHGATDPEHVTDAVRTQSEVKRSVSESSIRVDVDLLDSLMRLVGELVLTRNQVVSHAAGLGDSTLLRISQRLNLVASELQEGVMKTRMQPIDNVWNKLPRVVRDLGVSCGKSVRLHMEGRDTELDKTILEAIKDPLTHLVRNAVDHGIEMPAERVAAGKPVEGVLTLRAFHEGGHVIIEIADDGAGIDVDQDRRQGGVERACCPADQLGRLSERELLPPDLPARLLHRREGHQRLRPRRRHGRGQDQHRAHRRHDRHQQPPRRRHHAAGQDPADAGDHPRARRRLRVGDRYAIPQVNLLELVRLDGEQARARRSRGSTACRSTGCGAACCRWCTWRRSSGWCRSARRRDGSATTARSTSSCCRPRTGSSGSSSTRSTTPRRSSSSRSASSSSDRRLRRRHHHGRRPGRADPRRAGPGAAGARAQRCP